MSADPWTGPDPKPGDFDAVLAAIAPAAVEFHEGVPGAKLTVVGEPYSEAPLSEDDTA